MERADVVKDRQVVFERLAEPDPGIDAESLEIDPAPTGPPRRDRPGSRAPRRPRRSTYGSSCMVFGSPFICISTMPAPVSATAANIEGSSPAEMSFTMAAPASSAARATWDLRVSTDTGTSGMFLDDASDNGHDALHLLVGGDDIRARPRRLTPDVEQIGAVDDHLRGVLHGVVHAGVGAAVGEGIGRDVDDPHDQGALMQRDRVRPASPDRLVRHGRIVVRCTASRPHGLALRATACRCGSWPPGACARRCGTGPAPLRSRSPSPAS